MTFTHRWEGCKMFDAPLRYSLYYRLRCFGWAFSRFLWHGVSIQKGVFERLRESSMNFWNSFKRKVNDDI